MQYQERMNENEGEFMENEKNVEEKEEMDELHNGEMILEGEPLDVLQNDNILNRIGLEVPFMIDLSVKLRDYELISDIELDQDRMVDILWK